MSPHPPPRGIGAPTLLLVPTALERRRLDDLGGTPAGLAIVETCGFGPLAAAARAAQLLGVVKPARVVLLGICGSYDLGAHPVGSALEFDEVAIDGVGVGEGAERLAPPKLGFPQWPGSPRTGAEVFDRLALATAPRGSRLLLTTCSASGDREQARDRRERFPAALAEDMEGFAVALACSLHGVPLRIVRGVSNEVGDRAPEHWRIPAALAAARELALELLSKGAGWSSR